MRTRSKLAGVAIAIAVTTSPAQAERIFGVTSGNTIVTFDSATPGTTTSSGAIGGLAMNETLSGIDLRPANRTLYSVGSSGNLYAITKNASGRDYTATSVGMLTVAPSGSNFGIDFNPTVDRLRYVSDTNQNLRINPNNPMLAGPPAGTINDGALTFNGSPNFDLIAVGYRNSRAGATSTVLYGLDAISDSFVRATNANAGTYTNTNVLGNAFGPLGFSFGSGDRVSLDISGGSNQAFFTINDNFYTVGQLSGVGSFVGSLGEQGITGITAGAVPEPASWAMMIGGFGLTGAAMRRRRSSVVAA